MPVWLQALFWGTLAGGALVLGSALSWWWTIPPKVVSLIMSFGAGVLISALAFDLVDEAARTGGLWPTAAGFLAAKDISKQEFLFWISCGTSYSGMKRTTVKIQLWEPKSPIIELDRL